jgi:hypothetical protein
MTDGFHALVLTRDAVISARAAVRSDQLGDGKAKRRGVTRFVGRYYLPVKRGLRFSL